MRDYAQVKAEGRIDKAVADLALNMLKVDANGFDHMDRRLLMAMIEKFDGGPVGVDSLAAAIGEERDTIEDVYEPFLIQQGFIMRTPRGRVATRHAYLHLVCPCPPATRYCLLATAPVCLQTKKPEGANKGLARTTRQPSG